MNQVRVQGVVVGPRNALVEFTQALELHAMRPVIDRIFAWEDFSGSLDYLKSGSHFGKVVLRLN
jgi:NADPH:quinone reductase-like Zn-dependent oxidoreductase